MYIEGIYNSQTSAISAESKMEALKAKIECLSMISEVDLTEVKGGEE